jgi:hypothetical protein
MKVKKNWSGENLARADSLNGPLVERWGNGAQAQLIEQLVSDDEAELILQVLAVEHRTPFTISIRYRPSDLSDFPSLLPRMEEALIGLLEAELGISAPTA